MEIRWRNIFALLLIIFVFYVFVKIRPFLNNIFDDLNFEGYGYCDPNIIVILFGMACITIVAVIKIFSDRRR
ncbi:MAG: hypothetical protein UU48_C0032G0004 [Candidatus Uhrbacteria bacterium GW2011_GWF2_41_16]|uniref:Uncharacterized protein n=1 Tax=Candidatus Uhrbacteria bacterium GW2011_GWF2_41_16 TaxID=1618997 RepID=A0A0G0XHV5_9BACT|nr:MAG: hypothetical protein UU48_C0032G0004 [Candidatus Uhrbacteria bacterium GW2011_GWF2_41_16]